MARSTRTERAARFLFAIALAACGSVTTPPPLDERPGDLDGPPVIATLPSAGDLPPKVAELVQEFDALEPEVARARVEAIEARGSEARSGAVLAALRGLAAERGAETSAQDAYRACAERAARAALERWRAFCTARAARVVAVEPPAEDSFLCLPASAPPPFDDALVLDFVPSFVSPLAPSELVSIARDVRGHLERSGLRFREPGPVCRPELGRRARVRIRCDVDAAERCALEVAIDGDGGVTTLRAAGPERATDLPGWRQAVGALERVDPPPPSPIPDRTMRGDGFRIEHWIAFERAPELSTHRTLRTILPALARCRQARTLVHSERSVWLVEDEVFRLSLGGDGCVWNALAPLRGRGRVGLVLAFDPDRGLPLVRSCGAAPADPALGASDWIDARLVRALSACVEGDARMRVEFAVGPGGASESIAIEPPNECARSALAEALFPCALEPGIRTLATTIELTRPRAAAELPE